mmetsp:Transcript_18289/g.73116  ORF Transcript_18289/g.73116 Transcript_18289/m.73116 type:complete len:285 (+) Transcript_18289:614-1468(+)
MMMIGRAWASSGPRFVLGETPRPPRVLLGCSRCRLCSTGARSSTWGMTTPRGSRRASSAELAPRTTSSLRPRRRRISRVTSAAPSPPRRRSRPGAPHPKRILRLWRASSGPNACDASLSADGSSATATKTLCTRGQSACAPRCAPRLRRSSSRSTSWRCPSRRRPSWRRDLLRLHPTGLRFPVVVPPPPTWPMSTTTPSSRPSPTTCRSTSPTTTSRPSRASRASRRSSCPRGRRQQTNPAAAPSPRPSSSSPRAAATGGSCASAHASKRRAGDSIQFRHLSGD